MYYVMSDLHGEYQKYLRMLELLQLSEEDSLFILGDMVDRGKQPVTLIQDIMTRKNIFPIMGNHDCLAWCFLQNLCMDITSESIMAAFSNEDAQEMLLWIDDGGATTFAEFQKISIPERKEIVAFLESLPLYEIVHVKDKKFILVHAGLGNFRPDKPLSEYLPEELLLTRGDPDRRFFEDENMYIITGHTPTPLISGKPEIYHSMNNIYIDCGACFETGRLACLCLDTMQEFYV